MANSLNEKWLKAGIHGEYFPHLDGIRCLAVLPVVFYHLLGWVCPGGFLGVDVFFVLSGYLICGGIMRDLELKRFSLVSFYFRRIRRIFPAYFVVVMVTLITGISLYHWGRIVPLAQTTLFSVFFSTNLYFWLDMGYFQPTAHGNPLLNLWSLGIEEQFYILVPIVLMFFWRIRKGAAKHFLTIMLAVSFLGCLLAGQKGASTSGFYLLPTRAWELLAGAVLAGWQIPSTRKPSGYGALAGVVLLFWSFFCLHTGNTQTLSGTSVEIVIPFAGSFGIFPFPGLVTIPVIVGSLLLISYGNSGMISRILCSLPCISIGKISYSLYLWHWPVIVFSRYLNFDHPGPWSVVVVLGISFCLAIISWRWIETPVRLNTWFTPRLAFLSTAAGCGILVGICVFTIATDGLKNMIHVTANRFASEPRSFLLNLNKFSTPVKFTPPPLPLLDGYYLKRIGSTSRAPSFCLLGDSHAEALEPGLGICATEFGIAGLYVVRKMEPYVVEDLQTLEQQLLKWVGANPEIKDIYLVGRWLHYYGVKESIPLLGDKGHVGSYKLSESVKAKLNTNFRTTCKWFKERGKNVFVFTTVPEYKYGPGDIMARSKIIRLPYPVEISRADYFARQNPLLSILESIESDNLMTIVRLGETLLSGQDTIFMSADGTPFYKDGDHLTAAGSLYVSRAIAPKLWSIAQLAQ